jgi:AraC-like DNA-binding protein/quercetin dioxygenase-like cupin family protein
MLQRLDLEPALDGRVWSYANAASQNRPHRHAELELNLVTRGRGTYLLGNLRYEIRRGDLLWLFPGQEHVLVDQTPEFTMRIAVFRRRVIRRVALDDASKPLLLRLFPGESCRRLTAEAFARCEQLLQELTAAHPSVALHNAGIAYTLLFAWSSFLDASHVPVRRLHPAVERAAQLLQGQHGDATLTQLAHACALSESRLSRLFHQQTGSTVVEFRSRGRLDRFFTVYADGHQRTMLDAALEAGFGSYPQFHRVFRSLMGCSPAAYFRERR